MQQLESESGCREYGWRENVEDPGGIERDDARIVLVGHNHHACTTSVCSDDPVHELASIYAEADGLDCGLRPANYHNFFHFWSCEEVVLTAKRTGVHDWTEERAVNVSDVWWLRVRGQTSQYDELVTVEHLSVFGLEPPASSGLVCLGHSALQTDLLFQAVDLGILFDILRNIVTVDSTPTNQLG